MNEKSMRFYKEFDYFLCELLMERGRRKALSGDWVAASVDILGAVRMKGLIPALAVFGSLLMPFPLIGGLVGIGVVSKVYKAAFNNKEPVLMRLEKAKHLFETLSQLVEHGNVEAKVEIDHLFEDLVLGRDFIS
jgi:hypothetical protein